jgi:uncharacterized protein YkwD
MMRTLLLLLAAICLAAVLSGQAVALASDSGSEDLIAPLDACPEQNAADSPVLKQQQAMLCMTNFARRVSGLPAFADSDELDWSARAKSGDILRCDSFSHFACGRDFTYWIRESGYLSARCWRVGENLAWGTGQAGTVRSAFTALMHSPPHRHNILGPFAQVGIGLRIGSLEGHSEAHVWTQHFGSHCVSARSRPGGGKIQ